jgi:hypothetical protein
LNKTGSLDGKSVGRFREVLTAAASQMLAGDAGFPNVHCRKNAGTLASVPPAVWAPQR